MTLRTLLTTRRQSWLTTLLTTPLNWGRFGLLIRLRLGLRLRLCLRLRLRLFGRYDLNARDYFPTFATQLVTELFWAATYHGDCHRILLYIITLVSNFYSPI